MIKKIHVFYFLFYKSNRLDSEYALHSHNTITRLPIEQNCNYNVNNTADISMPLKEKKSRDEHLDKCIQAKLKVITFNGGGRVSIQARLHTQFESL